MALSRRLSRVEQGLDPKALFLHWLAEAHGHGSIEAYARWLAQQPDAADPFHRLLDRVEGGHPQGARQGGSRGPPPGDHAWPTGRRCSQPTSSSA